MGPHTSAGICMDSRIAEIPELWACWKMESAPSADGAEKRSLFERLHNSRLILWWSIAWAIGTFAISPLVNYVTPFLDPSYANTWTPDIYWRLVLYWHGGIFIPWITVLAVLLCVKYGLDKMPGVAGRLMRESVFVGGFFAVPIASIAGMFDIYDSFAWGIPLWTQILAFLIGDEMAIALLVAMLVHIRRSGGFRKAGMPYYTAFMGVFGAFIAALMGHVGGWITWFGPNPQFVSQYVNSTMYPVLGYSNSTSVITFTEDVVGSHSHLMLVSLMAGVVALVAVSFGYYADWSKNAKRVADFGFGVMILTLLAAVWIYVVSGVGNYQTPTLFTSGDNGVALDDLVTGSVGLGSVFVLAGLLVHSRVGLTAEGRPFYRDLLFLSAVGGWIMIYLVIPVTGFYINFNETFFQAAGLSFDDAFLRFHQDFGFFVLPALVTVVLALETYGISGRVRSWVGSLLFAGAGIAFLFGETYSLVTLSDWALYTALFGGFLIGAGALVGAGYLFRAKTTAAAIEAAGPPSGSANRAPKDDS